MRKRQFLKITPSGMHAHPPPGHLLSQSYLTELMPNIHISKSRQSVSENLHMATLDTQIQTAQL